MTLTPRQWAAWWAHDDNYTVIETDVAYEVYDIRTGWFKPYHSIRKG